jgi:hypothetical protein
MPRQAGNLLATVVPVAAARASYSGLLVLLFVAVSALGAAAVLTRLGPRGVRRAPAWDCGFPTADPATQYTAASFAQPIRRVFATSVFAARETVDMPLPGETRAAHFEAHLTDPAWAWIYAPIAAAVAYAGDRFNGLQFLTIRRYLSLVFGALVLLLLVLALVQ